MKNVSTYSNETISYSEKNLLWIDAADKKEMIFSFVFFFIILCSLLYFCFCGRGEFITTRYNGYSINRNPDNEYMQNFNFDLSPINLNNRFVRFAISFYQNSTDEFNEKLSFNYYIRRLFFNETHVTDTKNVTINFNLKDDQYWTDDYILYVDFILDLKFLSIGINLNASDTSFTSLEFNCWYGNSETTIFDAYYRTIFTILHIVLLALLIHKKRSNEVKKNYYEHSLLFPLLISIILSNNPFCIYRLLTPTSLYYKWMLYVSPIADGIIYFSQTIIFVCYSYRLSEKRDKELSIPDNSKSRIPKYKKIVICCIIISLIYIIFSTSLNYFSSHFYYFNNFPSYDDFQKYKKINYIRSCLVIIYSLSVFIFELASLIIIDSLSPPPFIYLLVGIIVFIHRFLFEGIFVLIDLFDEKDKNRLIFSKFIINNVFCLIFTLIHFPFDIREQCSQVDSKTNNNNDNESKALVIGNDDFIIDCA